MIPPSAVVVFDIHVIDFHNPNDNVDVRITYRPEVCNETTDVNDLVRYHYNCTLVDGTPLFSSWVTQTSRRETRSIPMNLNRRFGLSDWSFSPQTRLQQPSGRGAGVRKSDRWAGRGFARHVRGRKEGFNGAASSCTRRKGRWDLRWWS